MARLPLASHTTIQWPILFQKTMRSTSSTAISSSRRSYWAVVQVIHARPSAARVRAYHHYVSTG